MRPGSLPANLQGLWNNSNNPPWRSDYHSNINIQMNYWLAEPTNLSECALPFFNYVDSLRGVRTDATRQHYPGVRGWTVQTENNIFGAGSFKWNPPVPHGRVQDDGTLFLHGISTSRVRLPSDTQRSHGFGKITEVSAGRRPTGDARRLVSGARTREPVLTSYDQEIKSGTCLRA